jgi:hypothetical protein
LRIREAYLTFRERYVFFLPPNFLEKMQKINNMTLQFLTGNCGKCEEITTDFSCKKY